MSSPLASTRLSCGFRQSRLCSAGLPSSWRHPPAGPVKGERLAEAQDIPLQFLEHILLDLKHDGIVRAKRGAKGGYWLARPADEVTIAEVIRSVEGPIAHVQSAPPESITYRGSATHLKDVWIAVRASLRSVLENVTLADLVSGRAADRKSPNSPSPAMPGGHADRSPGIAPLAHGAAPGMKRSAHGDRRG